jgi:hypothetical protein
MLDKRKNNGGHSTKGVAGRKPKVKEEQANTLFCSALKLIYGTDKDDEAKINFIIELAKSQRGQIFIAEHLFGKAPQVIESDNPLFQIPIVSFGNKS